MYSYGSGLAAGMFTLKARKVAGCFSLEQLQKQVCCLYDAARVYPSYMIRDLFARAISVFMFRVVGVIALNRLIRLVGWLKRVTISLSLLHLLSELTYQAAGGAHHNS